jgi:hypothetical protein
MIAQTELARLADLIGTAEPGCGPVRLVAIDGGAAAGKSSLAAQLVPLLAGAAVLHLDDLLDGWAGQFDFTSRLHDEVLRPLSTGRPVSYRRYDWLAGQFADRVPVPVPTTLLVEGVSAVWACAGWSSVGIFLDVARAVRQRRWIERDGPLQPAWQDWLDREDRYFADHPLPPGTVVLRQ